jgi:hypothetical protein
MAVPNIPRALLNLASAQLRRVARRFRGVGKAVGRFGRRLRRQQEILAHAPQQVATRARRGRAAVVRSGNRWTRFDDHVLQPYRIERRVKQALRQAAASGRPIIVGPWISEVGYEALYWLPFLHWAMDRYGIDRQRVIAVSRGGTESWYSGLAARYVDVFDCMDPREFADVLRARREDGDQKQMASSAFDRQLVALVSERIGADDAMVLHPGLMYQFFRPFWYGDRSLQFLLRHADFARVRAALAASVADVAGGGAAGVLPALPALPKEYAAVKFYTGQALPDTPANRDTLRRCIERLAARMPVVMLDTAWTLDEHEDYAFDSMRGVTTLRPSLDPRTNLGLQTRVIAGARTFVGTCGGLAWLAPLMGVDTLAVYDDDRFLTAHLYAARYAYRYTGAASFSTLNVRALRSATFSPATTSAA